MRGGKLLLHELAVAFFERGLLSFETGSPLLESTQS